MPRGWLTAPVIGDGQEFPLDRAGEPIVTPDRGPFRASVHDRVATEGDRLEFVLGDGNSTCLVAYDVADDSDMAALGGEKLLAEADLDKAADRVAEADKLDALAQEMKVGRAGSAREVLRRVGQEIVPEFDERTYLGTSAAPPSGSFLVDTFSPPVSTLAEHTGEKGATWVTSLEMAIHGGGFVRSTGTTYRYAYASGLPASPDYSVEEGLICQSVVSARQSGPAMRISTGSDTSYQFYWVTNTGFSLVKRIAFGVEVVLGTYALVGEVGMEVKATIEGIGTAIKGYINGVERLSATDSAITAAGRAGLRQQGNATAGSVGDYIIATDAGKELALALEDSISLSDSLGKSTGHAEADTLALSDQVSKGVEHTEADSLPLSESLGRQMSKGLADALSLADSLAKGAVKFAADLLGLSDSIDTDVVVVDDEPAYMYLRDQPTAFLALDDRPQTALQLRDEASTHITLKDGPS